MPPTPSTRDPGAIRQERTKRVAKSGLLELYYPHAFPFENIPHAAPEGIDWVLVNGSPVLEEGVSTAELPGQVLRRS